MPLLTLKDKKSLVKCQGDKPDKWGIKKCSKCKLVCTIRAKLRRRSKN